MKLCQLIKLIDYNWWHSFYIIFESSGMGERSLNSASTVTWSSSLPPPSLLLQTANFEPTMCPSPLSRNVGHFIDLMEGYAMGTRKHNVGRFRWCVMTLSFYWLTAHLCQKAAWRWTNPLELQHPEGVNVSPRPLSPWWYANLHQDLDWQCDIPTNSTSSLPESSLKMVEHSQITTSRSQHFTSSFVFMMVCKSSSRPWLARQHPNQPHLIFAGKQLEGGPMVECKSLSRPWLARWHPDQPCLVFARKQLVELSQITTSRSWHFTLSFVFAVVCKSLSRPWCLFSPFFLFPYPMKHRANGGRIQLNYEE